MTTKSLSSNALSLCYQGELSRPDAHLKNLLLLCSKFFEESKFETVWRLLNRAVRNGNTVGIEAMLMYVTTLDYCDHVEEALSEAKSLYHKAPYRSEVQRCLLKLLVKMPFDGALLANQVAWHTLIHARDEQNLLPALIILHAAQIAPIGVCWLENDHIYGWLLDSTSLPHLTVTIEEQDFKLKPFLETPVLKRIGFGSGRDGFSLKLPQDRFNSIRIHLQGLDLAGSPIQRKPPQEQLISYPKTFNLLAPTSKKGVDIIIPVYKGLKETKACIQSILAAQCRLSFRVIVINDASPEPLLTSYLEDLALRKLIQLIKLPINQGFVGAVNQGFSVSQGRDIVLLNSDTMVHGNWLDRLHAVAYKENTIGTVTPLSNNGELVSFPAPMRASPMPSPEELARIDDWCSEHGSSDGYRIPVGVGFCLYIKRSCLDQVGFLDDSLIKQGYGEDTDFCIRVTLKGWRNVCASNTFVAHKGGISFGDNKKTWVARNIPRILERYPNHQSEYSEFLSTHQLAPMYQALQQWLLPFAVDGRATLVLLPDPIRASRLCQQLVAGYESQADRHHYFLQFDNCLRAKRLTLTSGNPRLPLSLTYNWSDEIKILVNDLLNAGFDRLEIHDPFGYPLDLLQALLEQIQDNKIVLHDETACDYSTRLHTQTRQLPLAKAAIEAIFQYSRVIMLASVSALQHHAACFPSITFTLDRPEFKPLTKQPFNKSAPVRIAVFFAGTPAQGFFNLLGMCRVLAQQKHDLEVIVIGDSWDDHALLATGRVWITGPTTWSDIPKVVKLYGCQWALHFPREPDIDGLAWQLARISGIPILAPPLGVYAEVLEPQLGDQFLPLHPSEADWLSIFKELLKVYDDEGND